MKIIPTRLDMIRTLPQGAVLAEIGCWKAYFATDIMELPNIGKLFCVDLWKKIEGYSDPLNDDDHEANYREAQHNLRGHLLGGRVKLIRGASLEVALNTREIPPLDAVYLDASHMYDDILADLRAWEKRLKPGAVIMGHDYTNNAMSRQYGWGVIKAVTQFCAETNWVMTAITDEDFASFKLEIKI